MLIINEINVDNKLNNRPAALTEDVIKLKKQDKNSSFKY